MKFSGSKSCLGRRLFLSCTALALSAIFVSTARAAMLVYDFALTPEEEIVPPTLGDATPTGAATLTADTSTRLVEITGWYDGLTSPEAGVHLHGPAAPGESGLIIIILSADGGVSGSFTGSQILSEPKFSSLLAGLTYINVHTADNGNGELRGQAVPSSGTLVVAGVSGLLASRRRRR